MKRTLLGVAAAVFCGAQLDAATITWTGAAGLTDQGVYDYGDANNWTPRLPKDNDWEDTVVFGASATPGTISLITPIPGNGGLDHERIVFETAGWVIDVGYFSLGTISSSGAGVNQINYRFEVQQAGTWTIAEGNTLYLNGSVYLKNYQVNLSGGGIVHTSERLSGFGSGDYGFRLTDGTTLRIDSNLINASGSVPKVYIASPDAKLEYMATEAAALSHIGSRIINETAFDLQVRDLGNGYVQVYVPEPGTAGLTAIVGAAFLARRRRA